MRRKESSPDPAPTPQAVEVIPLGLFDLLVVPAARQAGGVPIETRHESGYAHARDLKGNRSS